MIKLKLDLWIMNLTSKINFRCSVRNSRKLLELHRHEFDVNYEFHMNQQSWYEQRIDLNRIINKLTETNQWIINKLIEANEKGKRTRIWSPLNLERWRWELVIFFVHLFP